MRTKKKSMCLLMFILLAFLFSSCGSDDNMASNIENGTNSIDNLVSFSHSGCKELQQNASTQSAKAPLFGDEGVEFTCMSDGRLFLKHTNVMFCCEQDEIVVEAKLSDQRISLVEQEVNPKANCTCPYDLDVMVDGLMNGKYTVKIYKKGIDIPSMEFDVDYCEGNSGKFIKQ